MTQFLPSNLLALFAARDPIVFLPPAGKLSHEKVRSGFTGVGEFLQGFEDPKDTPPKTKVENREERMERKRRDKAERMAYKLEQQIATWNPQESASTTDPHKTLFVGRVNYDTSESKLRREFESYGPVKKIVMVFNQKTGKPRGYAFVEYEHERDMQGAFKNADGKKIDGRRIVVDVERGRTVKGWLPRRLGGGLGGTRRGGPEVNVKISGRDPDMDRPGDLDRGRRVGRSRENSRSRVRSRSRSMSRRDKPRDRDRSLRDRHRVERGRSRDRDRKDKDKDKDKDKEKEHKKRKRSKSRSPLPRRDSAAEEGEIKGAKKRRAHEKEKKRHRSKSRDRDKDKKKDRKDRDKDKKRSKEDRIRVKDEPNDYDVHVKEEPVDDEYPNNYDPYEEYGVYVKTEPGMEGEANHDENYDEYNNAFM